MGYFMSKALQTISLHLPLGSVDAYVARVQQFPMLTAEAEETLAKKFKENNDLDSAREMVMAHLRYVVRIARGYMGYGLPLGDLIQEGNIGLMKAVKRFDPSMGVRLVSFAVHWIKAEIHEFVLRNWRIVKVATTKAQRKLFFNLRGMKKRLGWFSQAEREQVADDLGVDVAVVNEMEQRLNAMDAPYDAPERDEDHFSFTPADYLEDTASNPLDILAQANEAEHQQKALQQALTTLDPRSLDILKQRWLSDKKATLHDLAAKYDVSAERIRQIEQQAMTQLKDAVLH